MDANGKIVDLIIEDVCFTDPATGVRHRSNEQFKVWADAGLEDTIKNIPGVTHVFRTLGESEYSVYLDPRYDREVIKESIEAKIKLNKLEKK
jgi:hypothetical protein